MRVHARMHPHKYVPRRHKNTSVCAQMIYLRANKSSTWRVLFARKYKIHRYADKFGGHFLMFPGLLTNKIKIRRNEYTKEQSRTKKNFAPVFCVFAYLAIPQRNHSLTPSFLTVLPRRRRSIFSPRTINFPVVGSTTPTAPFSAHPLPKIHTFSNIASTPPKQYH